MQRELPEAFRVVMRSIIDQDLETTLNCFTPGGSFRDPTGSWEGRDSLEAFFTVGFRSTRETTWETHLWLQEGDLFSAEWTYGFALAAGPFQGRRVTLEGLSIVELRDGRIFRWRDYWDSADFLGQLGAKQWSEVMPPEVLVHFFQNILPEE